MARKVQVILSDDLDENLSADETVSFSLDGTSYEIDLAEKNAKELREVFSRYVSAARKVGRGTRASGGGRSRATGGRWTASRPAPSATGPARTVTRSATAAASRPASSRPTRPRTEDAVCIAARRSRTADVRVTSARFASPPARLPARGSRAGRRPGRRGAPSRVLGAGIPVP